MKNVMLALLATLLAGCAWGYYTPLELKAGKWAEKVYNIDYSNGQQKQVWSRNIDEDCAEYWSQHLLRQGMPLKDYMLEVTIAVGENCYQEDYGPMLKPADRIILYHH